MAESLQIASLEGGELRVPGSVGKQREVVLALPLSRLLVKLLRIPAGDESDPVAFATPVLQAMSPYPDEPLTVSCETVGEEIVEVPVVTGEDRIPEPPTKARLVLAATLPESSAEDVGAALDESNLSVTRVDILALGRLPEIRTRLAGSEKGARVMVVMDAADGLSVLVLDDGRLSAIRAIPPGPDVVRDLMLCLLEAEEFAGDRPLKEIVTVGDVSAEGFDALAPVRSLGDLPDATPGLLARAADAATLNALPDSWREVLNETRFKHKMRVVFGVAVALWALLLVFLIGTPRFYRYKASRLNNRPAQKAEAAKVEAKRDQVEAVRKVSNHDYGALEALRAVVGVMPSSSTGITLTRWNFKRDDVLTFAGTFDSELKDEVWKFSANLQALRLSAISENEDDTETPYFTKVEIPSGLMRKSFDMKCSFKPEKEGL